MNRSPSKQELLAQLRNSIQAIESEEEAIRADGAASDSEFASSGLAPLQSENEKTADDAYRQILRWVSVRERSTKYLRERLLKEGFAEQDIAFSLERACRVHAVDDRRYADSLVRMKLAAGKGLRDAEREIRELGIDPATLDAWQEHDSLGREAEVNRALDSLIRRPPRAKQQREAAFRRLVSLGFSTDIAASAARIWTERQ